MKDDRLCHNEIMLRQQAIADGYNPDEIVSTELRDSSGERVEMPIWQTYFYG